MTYEIPIRGDLASQSLTVALDGVLYQLALRWNERAESWSMDLFTVDGEALLLGVRLVPAWNLLWRGTDTRLPAGSLVLHDRTGANEPPGPDDLGARHTLLYLGVS